MGSGGRDLAARVEAVRQARHSSEMEGVVTNQVTRANQERYTAGTIDGEELVRRGLARHGVSG